MKKNLIILLAIICMTVPIFNDIDAFVRQDSKLLVHDFIYTETENRDLQVPVYSSTAFIYS